MSHHRPRLPLPLVVLLVLPAAAALAAGGVHAWARATVDVAAILAALAWLWARSEPPSWRRTPLDLLAVAGVAFTVAAVPTSVVAHTSRQEAVHVAAALLVAALVAQTTARAGCERAGRLFGALAAGVGGVALAGFAAAHAGLLGTAAPARLASPFANPDHLAAFVGGGAILCLAAALRPGRGRVPFAVLAAVAGATVILTASRGGLIGLAAGLTLIVVATRSRRTALVVLLLVATVGAVLLVPFASAPVVERVASLEDPLAASPSRLVIWRATAELIAARPWLGWGPGSFRDAFTTVQPAALAPFTVAHAHNDLLEVAAEHGVPAAAVALAALTVLLVAGLRAPQPPAAALGALVALAVHGLVEFNLDIPAVRLSLAVVVGLVLGAVARDPARDLRRLRWPGLAAALLLSLVVLTPLLGARAVDRAADLRRRGDFASAARLLARAGRLDPGNPELVAARARSLAFVARSGDRAAGAAAEAAFARAHALAPTRSDLARDWAALAVERGDAARAEAILRAAVATTPTRPAGHLDLARFLLASGRQGEAVDAVRRALELDPRLLGEALAALWQAGCPVATLAAAVPQQPAALARGAAFLAEHSAWCAAAELQRQAVELAPGAATAAEHLRLAVRCGRAAAVAELAAAYRTRFPADPVVLDALAAVAESSGDLAAARALLSELVAAAPGDLRRVVRLAGALRSSGDCGAALALFAAERRRFSRDPRFHLEEGAVALACQQPRLAILPLTEAARLDPRSAAAHERLGATLLQLGQVDEAARAFTACLTVDPAASGCRNGLRRAVAKGARQAR